MAVSHRPTCWDPLCSHSVLSHQSSLLTDWTAVTSARVHMPSFQRQWCCTVCLANCLCRRIMVFCGCASSPKSQPFVGIAAKSTWVPKAGSSCWSPQMVLLSLLALPVTAAVRVLGGSRDVTNPGSLDVAF